MVLSQVWRHIFSVLARWFQNCTTSESARVHVALLTLFYEWEFHLFTKISLLNFRDTMARTSSLCSKTKFAGRTICLVAGRYSNGAQT